MPPPFAHPGIESSLKRVRVLFAGKFIVDTTHAKLVWEHQRYPAYFFPAVDLSDEYLRRSETQVKNPGSNTEIYDLVLGKRRALGAVAKYSGPIDGVAGKVDVKDLIKITFRDADAWFEEEEEIFVHAKDPYKRVDVLQSSRHIIVKVDGVEVANTQKPRLLYETNLPIRTYIPKTDCRLDLFEHSDLETQCPYKGIAGYYSVRLPDSFAENVVWWYRLPLAAVTEIRGYVAFYDEKVDVWVDGVKQERPRAP